MKCILFIVCVSKYTSFLIVLCCALIVKLIIVISVVVVVVGQCIVSFLFYIYCSL